MLTTAGGHAFRLMSHTSPVLVVVPDSSAYVQEGSDFRGGAQIAEGLVTIVAIAPIALWGQDVTNVRWKATLQETVSKKSPTPQDVVLVECLGTLRKSASRQSTIITCLMSITMASLEEVHEGQP